MEFMATVEINQIVNELRPDLPFQWEIKWPGASSGRCCASFEDASLEVSEALRCEANLWYRTTIKDIEQSGGTDG